MPLSNATWMTPQAIARARRILESAQYRAEGMDPDGERIAAEGLACLDGAQPEYLINLIPQNHPDRVAAIGLLKDMWDAR